MAMMPRRDRSAYYGSLQGNSQMAGEKARTEAQKSSIDNDTTLARKDIKLAETKFQNNYNAGKQVVTGLVNLVYTGLTGDFSPILGDKINSLIQDSQTQQANAELLPILTEGARIAKESLASGASRYQEVEVFDSEGNSKGKQLAFTPGDDLKKWYEDAMASVDSMGFLPGVTDKMKANLTSSYWANVQQLQSDAIDKAYTDLENAYATNLETALVSDAQLYAQYNGELPEGVHYQGMAIIAGRSDFSDMRKQSEAVEYFDNLRHLAVQDKAVSIGRTSKDGLAAVDRYLQEQKFLTPQERNSYYAIAATSFQQMDNAYSSQAEDMMADAFISGGSTPGQVMKEIQDIGKANNIPDSILNHMIETAKTEQRTGVRAMVANQLQADMNGGLKDMVETRDGIQSGAFDAWFENMPEEKVSAIAQYDAKIQEAYADLSPYLSMTPEDLEKADKEVVDAFKNDLDGLKTKYEIGVPGEQIMKELDAMLPGYQDQLQTSSGYNSFLAAKQKFTQDNFNELPANVKVEAEASFDSFMLGMGIDPDSRNLSEEQKKMLQDVENYYLGLVSDLTFEVGRNNITAADYNALLQKAYQGYLLDGKLVSKDLSTKVKLPDAETPVSAVMPDNLSYVDRIWQDDKGNSLVYLNDYAGYSSETRYDPESGTVIEIPLDSSRRPQYSFYSGGVQETYDNLESFFRTPLVDYLQVDDASVTSSPFVYADGTAIAVPEFHVTNGTEQDHYIIQDGCFKKYFPDEKRWVSVAKLNDDGSVTSLDISTGKEIPTSRYLQKGNKDSDYTKYIHLGNGAVSVDPEIVNMPGYDYEKISAYVDSDKAYSKVRDSIKDALHSYEMGKQQPEPGDKAEPDDKETAEPAAEQPVEADEPSGSGITADNIQDFIKPEYEITPQGRQLTGVTINPEIYSMDGYSKSEVINLARNTPKLSQVWQMVARELKDKKEDN